MLALDGVSVNNCAMQIQWHIGDVVRKLRQMAGLTQKQLAQITGLRSATISAFENTGNYNRRTLEAIAGTLKATLSDIHAMVPRTKHAGICPTENAEHEIYHVAIEKLLHGAEDRALLQIVIAALGVIVNDSLTPGPERKKFSPDEPARPGDIVEAPSGKFHVIEDHPPRRRRR